MPVTELFAFLLAIVVFGGVAGIIAGLFGVGGGLVVVPLLYTIFKSAGASPDVAIHTAVGTSLLTIVLTSISSLRAHSRHDAVDKTILKNWGVAIILGSVLGGIIANQLSGPVLSIIFGSFTAAIAAYMGLAPSHIYAGKKLPKGIAQKSMAFFIGLISALVGVGGGSLTVPALVMYRVSIHRAIGTASAIGLLISLPASLVFMLSQTAHGATAEGGSTLIGSFGNVNLLAFALLAPVTTLTAPVGAKLAHRLPAINLRRGFAFFLAFISIRMIVAALT